MKDAVILQVENFTIHIQRKAVKYLRLKYQPKHYIVLNLPLKASLTQAKRFIEQQLNWLKQCQLKQNKQNKIIETNHTLKQPIYEDGSIHYLWAKPYCLKCLNLPDEINEIKKNSQTIENIAITQTIELTLKVAKHLIMVGQDTIFIQLSNTNLSKHTQTKAEIIEHLFKKLYKYLLERALPNLLDFWQTKLGIGFKSYRVQHMLTRWGSCSYLKQTARFNSALAKYALHLLEYVVVHELCHLYVPNHSSAFKALLKQHYPHYREAELALKELRPT